MFRNRTSESLRLVKADIPGNMDIISKELTETKQVSRPESSVTGKTYEVRESCSFMQKQGASRILFVPSGRSRRGFFGASQRMEEAL